MNSIFIVFVGVFLSIFRWIFNTHNESDLILIMAIINTVAFIYVILLIGNDILSIFEKKIQVCNYSDSKRKKYIHKTSRIMCFVFIVFCFIGIIYVCKFRSGIFNDILSIMALVLSITTNSVSENIAKIVYDYI